MLTTKNTLRKHCFGGLTSRMQHLFISLSPKYVPKQHETKKMLLQNSKISTDFRMIGNMLFYFCIGRSFSRFIDSHEYENACFFKFHRKYFSSCIWSFMFVLVFTCMCFIWVSFIGYPNRDAAHVALLTVRRWLEQHHDKVNLFYVELTAWLQFKNGPAHFFNEVQWKEDRGL